MWAGVKERLLEYLIRDENIKQSVFFEEYRQMKLQEEQIDRLSKRLEETVGNWITVSDKLEAINKDLDKANKEKKLEDALNSKYPIVDTKQYMARKIKNTIYRTDVRAFCGNPNCFDFVQVAKEAGGSTDDRKVLNLQKWVIANIRYVTDLHNLKELEWWFYPEETLFWKAGDCEDMSCLLYCLCRAAGVPYYKLRLRAGVVYNHNGESMGGHVNLQYYVESKGYWVSVNPCFYPDLRAVDQRGDYKEEPLYGNENLDTWFSWNEKYVFSKK